MQSEAPNGPADYPVSELLRLAESGDQIAWTTLVQIYEGRLIRMVSVRLDRRLAPRVDPADIVQETLIDAAAGLNAYLQARPLPFYPWLRQLALDRVIDQHRKHLHAAGRSVARENRMLPGESTHLLAEKIGAGCISPSGHAIREETRRLVRDAINSLGEIDREILVLRHLEGLETDEIASLLRIRPDAVRARHVRAIERLRQRISRDPRS